MTSEQWIFGLAGLAAAVGIWLLMRPSTWRKRTAGGILALVGCGLVASQLVPLGPPSAAVVFYPIAFVTLVSAVAAISLTNPVYCAIWFGLMLLGSSALLFFQGAQFLAAATLVVYAGAILVTFLFLLMLAQPEGRAQYDRTCNEPLVSALVGATLASLLAGTILRALQVPDTVPAAETDRLTGVLADEHVATFGRELFGRHVIAVEAAAVMLLVALVAAALIVGRPRGFVYGPLPTPAQDGDHSSKE